MRPKDKKKSAKIASAKEIDLTKRIEIIVSLMLCTFLATGCAKAGAGAAQPPAEQQTAEQPGADQPVAEQAAAEQPATDQPAAQQKAIPSSIF